MVWLAKLITALNIPLNFLGKFVLGPLMVLPGWLSNTIISAVVGVVFLLIFKYISNQNAIGKVKDAIKANMLAIKLFKDSMAVTLASEAKLFKAALLLLLHAMIPMLVMIGPVVLILAQMGMWYQFRPLQVNETVLVTVTLNDNDIDYQKVSIESPNAKVVRKVNIPTKNTIEYEIKATQAGQEPIILAIDGQQYEKQLIVDEGFFRTSPKRPGHKFFDCLLYPAEQPFEQASIIQSINIDYPLRGKKMIGVDIWILQLLLVSIIAAFIFKPLFKVKF